MVSDHSLPALDTLVPLIALVAYQSLDTLRSLVALVALRSLVARYTRVARRSLKPLVARYTRVARRSLEPLPALITLRSLVSDHSLPALDTLVPLVALGTCRSNGTYSHQRCVDVSGRAITESNRQRTSNWSRSVEANRNVGGICVCGDVERVGILLHDCCLVDGCRIYR